jgi:hypothetical protein
VESESQGQKHLCEHAEAEIRELKAAGITPTLDEIVWINDLSRAVENPNGGEHRHFAGKPSRAGSVWLWPFTIQARLWYEDALEWFDGDVELDFFGLAYALVHGRDPHAFLRLDGYQSAKQAIKAFQKQLDCTRAELSAAIVDVIPADDEIAALEKKFEAEDRQKRNIAEKKPEAVNWDDLIAELVAATGLPADTWRRDYSQDMVLRILNIVRRQYMAMAGGDSKKLDEGDPYIIATRRLGIAIKEIKRRHKKRENEDAQ